MEFYHAEITETDGEHENSSPVVIKADSLKECCRIIDEIVSTWYDGDSQKNGDWVFFEDAGRSVRVGRVVPTTAEEFLQHHLYRRKK